MTVELFFLIAFLLLILEAFIPSLGLLGFGGFIAFVGGVIMMITEGHSHFYGLSIQSVVALGTLIFVAFAVFGYFVFKSFRKDIETGLEHMIGKQAKVQSWDNQSGIVTFEGEDWRAVSDDQLNPDDIVTIASYQSMTLTVNKDN